MPWQDPESRAWPTAVKVTGEQYPRCAFSNDVHPHNKPVSPNGLIEFELPQTPGFVYRFLPASSTPPHLRSNIAHWLATEPFLVNTYDVQLRLIRIATGEKVKVFPPFTYL